VTLLLPVPAAEVRSGLTCVGVGWCCCYLVSVVCVCVGRDEGAVDMEGRCDV
jgi:hypothetical protein